MLLNAFLENFEEKTAERKIRDFLTTHKDGTVRAAFLEHFLDSVFQPIFEIRNTQLRVVGYEALIRPVAGREDVDPSLYFGSLLQDDQSFVDLLCRELHLTNFSQRALSHELLALNISPEALSEHMHRFEELKQQIGSISNLGLKNHQICFELDLSQGIDAGVVYTFASNLKETGVTVALEGFDADCASFARVLHCRPDVVKFNRSWLEGNLSNSAQIELVANVVTAIKSTGAKTHIERVENQAEYLFAMSCGFDRLQGFYFAKPNPDLERPVYNPIQ